MNVLIFSEYYYPERFLIHEISEGLVKKGNNVTVVTGKPNYNFPKGNVLKEYKKINYEVINGVEVYRCNVFGRGKNKIRLLLNYFSYVVNAKKIIKKIKKKYDVVYCYQLTPVIQLIPALYYAEKNNIPILCYCLDLAPLSGESTLKKTLILKKIYKKISKKLYNKCTKILVTSKSFIKYLTQINEVDPNKIKYLPQHAPNFDCKLNIENDNNNRQYLYQEKVYFMFAGNIGSGPRLDNFIKSAKILINKGINCFKIIFVGEGSNKQRLIALVSKLQLENFVIFENGVRFDEMKKKYLKADFLLISLRKGQITIPGKLQAYMSTGKPILGMIDGSGRELIEEVGCGICTNAENYIDFANVMIYAIDNRLKLMIDGKKGQIYYNNFFTLDSHLDCLNSELILLRK